MGAVEVARGAAAPAAQAVPELEGLNLARRAARGGLVGGIAVVFLGAVGMIENFHVRNLIHDVVTLGRLLLALPAFLAAYVALRPRILRGKVEAVAPRSALWAGALAGAVTAAVTAVAIGLWQIFEPQTVRAIFVSATEGLVRVLTFDQGLGGGAPILILGGAGLGVLGAALRVLDPRYRRPVAAGLFTVMVLALFQRIFPTLLGELDVPKDWLYSRRLGGLTRVGAVVVFAAGAGLAFVWRERRTRVTRAIRELPAAQRGSARVLAFLVIAGFLAVLPQLLGSVLSNVLGRVGIFILMGLGLNIVVGFAGLLDLGYVAFFAVGAYFLALFTGANLVTSLGETQLPGFSVDLNFYAGLPVVILVAAFIGLLIGAPVLRLRGDYLAIVTLGFGEIARILAQSKALQPWTGGPQGLRDVTNAELGGFGFRSPQHFYYLVFALVLIALYVSWRLANSRTGRAWAAMREDEQVAEAMGVATVKYKLLAFAMGGAVGCLSGAMFAVQIGSVQPASFDILVSITVLAVVILGGMGSTFGVILGALALVGIPELLAEFEEFRLLVYGAVIIVIMILKPEGLLPNVRRMRELHEEELSQDAWLKKQEEPLGEATIIAGGGAGEKGGGAS